MAKDGLRFDRVRRGDARWRRPVAPTCGAPGFVRAVARVEVDEPGRRAAGRLHQALDAQLGVGEQPRRNARGARRRARRARSIPPAAGRRPPAAPTTAWSSAERLVERAVRDVVESRRPAVGPAAGDRRCRRARSCAPSLARARRGRPTRPAPAGRRARRRPRPWPRRGRRSPSRRGRSRSRARASRTGSSAARPALLARQVGPGSRQPTLDEQRQPVVAQRSSTRPVDRRAGRSRRASRGRAAARRARVRPRGTARRPERLERPPLGVELLARRRPACGDARASPAVVRSPQRCAVAGRRGRRHGQLGGDRWRGGTHVGRELGERHVRLVADADDDRARDARPRPARRLLVERPEVLERAAAAREDDDVGGAAGLRDRSSARGGAAPRRSVGARRAPWTWHGATTTRTSGQRRARTLRDVVEHGAREARGDADRPRPRRQRPLAASASNSPSAASCALSASNRSARSPKPAGWSAST